MTEPTRAERCRALALYRAYETAPLAVSQEFIRLVREAEAAQLRAVQRIVGVRDVEHQAERGVM